MRELFGIAGRDDDRDVGVEMDDDVGILEIHSFAQKVSRKKKTYLLRRWW